MSDEANNPFNAKAASPMAFPSPPTTAPDGCGIVEGQPGMTLRDYYAGQAMGSIIDNLSGRMTAESAPDAARIVAQVSWLMADAMIAEREK